MTIIGMGDTMAVQLESIVGSRLYGIAVNDGLEDTDYMAVALDTRKQMLGLGEWKGSIVQRTKPDGVRSEAGDVDRVTYGLRKFVRLAIGGNPSILALLFSPPEMQTVRTEVGEELLTMREKFLSCRVRAPFLGYATQQHERMLGLRGQRNVTRPELVEKYGYDTKYAAHIIRLCFQGIEVLTTGIMTLPMKSEEIAILLAIRTGKYTLAEVSEMITTYERNLSSCNCILPDEPDKYFIEAWMMSAYVSYFTCHSRDQFTINKAAK